MHRVVAIAGMLLLGCATAVERVPSGRAARSTARVFAENATSVDVLDRALPAVVLMLAQHADGTIHYGSGLIVSHDGLVITNLHVVTNAQSLSALLYRKDRLSYTPMDGGLTRYLFENQKELVSARLVRGDPTTDLALVKLDTDTSHVILPELSSRPLKPGEPVLALGHPQETVWSFTAGVVSALHHGAIQHDAAVNRGNSGGPLLTARGEVVGINTSKVLGGADGVAFARPIDLVRNLLAEVMEPRALDLSTPERAVLSCIRAQELASPDIAHCFDWEERWNALESALKEYVASGRMKPAEAKQVQEALDRLGGKAGWVEDRKRAIIAFVRGDPLANPEKRPDGQADASSAPLKITPGPDSATRIDDSEPSPRYDPRLLEQNGLKVDVLNPRAIQEVLRMGIRVEAVSYGRPDLAWVLIAGRNTDGSEYRYSECWVKRGGRWLQRTPPRPEDAKLRPAEFAPPLDDYEVWRDRMVHSLLKASGTRSGTGKADGTKEVDPVLGARGLVLPVGG